MGCEEGGKRVGKDLLQSVRATDPDEPAGLRSHAQSHVFDGIGLVDHRPSVLVDLLAHLCNVEAPSGTLEQPDAKALLEKRDPATDARLRDAQHPRGRGKAAVPHDRGEELEVVEVVHRRFRSYHSSRFFRRTGRCIDLAGRRRDQRDS
jgi:hypothetical protein